MSDQRSDEPHEGSHSGSDGAAPDLTPGTPAPTSWATPGQDPGQTYGEGSGQHYGHAGTRNSAQDAQNGFGASTWGTAAPAQAPHGGGSSGGQAQGPWQSNPQPGYQAPWQNGPRPGHQTPAPYYQAPPKPGVIPLRPLGLGEILDGAFQACRKNPIATFGNAILLQGVVTLVTVLLLGNVLSSFEVFESANPSPDSLIGAFASLGVFASIAGVVSGVALLVLQGILVIPIARAVINQKTSFAEAWRLARGRLLPLLGYGLLAFFAGLLGFALIVGISALAIAGLQEYSALLIVPLVLGAIAALIWIGTKLVVAPAALMLEQRGPIGAVKRSWILTRGNWWRTFGIVLLTSLIVSIIASVISTPLSFAVTLIFGLSASSSATPDVLDSLPIIAATQAITALFTAIGYAFQSGVTSLLYVDLRIRREGFDVVLMREHEQGASGGARSALPGGTSSFGHQAGGTR